MAGTHGESRGRTGDPGRHGMPIVRSVERAARIAAALYRAPGGKRVADLGKELGVPKTTALRLLRTLVAVGVAERDLESDRYHRNPSLWLAMTCDLPALESTDDTVYRALRHVEEETGLLVNMAIPDLGRRAMLCIPWYLRTTDVGTAHGETRPVPMHATALGEVYLASLPETDLREWVRGELPRFTVHTITSRRRLMAELARVRERGYAVCRGTYTPGRFAVAVPARDAKRRTVAAVSVAGPEELLSDISLAHWLPSMREASERLSQLVDAAPLPPRE